MPLYIKMFLIVDLLIFTASMWMMWRNNKVYKMRRDIIDKIFDRPDYGWRVEEYRKVTYDKMVFSLKPVKPESFYEDMSFLRDSVKSPIQNV